MYFNQIWSIFERTIISKHLVKRYSQFKSHSSELLTHSSELLKKWILFNQFMACLVFIIWLLFEVLSLCQQLRFIRFSDTLIGYVPI